jgi:AcrR family transcriptional regulator/DNA-binding MarR family transcriptional regulator
MPAKGRAPSEGAAPEGLTSSLEGVRSSVDRRTSSAAREGAHVAEMQRRRLLLAFAEVLAEDGLQDAGVGRVCKRAGVSRRTYYDLFEDREACFVAVLDAAVQRISQSVLPAYELEGRWRERVRGALGVLLLFFDEEPALARVCLVETLKAGPVVSERRRLVLDALTTVVDEGRSEAKAGSWPPPLTAQSTVGGAVSIIHARLLEEHPGAREQVEAQGQVDLQGPPGAQGHRGPKGGSSLLVELLNPLMSMIVHPYLGPAAARRELEHPLPSPKPANNNHHPRQARDPFKDLPIRLTFRTARVLAAIGFQPGASNRQIANTAGIADQGQISRLLNRLENVQLIENHGHGHTKGEPNAWTLTERGRGIMQAIGQDDTVNA